MADKAVGFCQGLATYFARRLRITVRLLRYSYLRACHAPVIVARKQEGGMAGLSGRVLVIDSDRDIAEIVHAVLTDAGFGVSLLVDVCSDAIRVAVSKQEPDCVLLDGQCSADYGESWLDAAWMQTRGRPIPVIMFTVDAPAASEARELSSARSHAARFEAVLGKPFDLDELVDCVARAVGHAVGSAN